MVWVCLNQQNLGDELICRREVVGEIDAQVLFTLAVIVDMGEFGAGIDLVSLAILLAVDGNVAVFEELAVALKTDQ